MAVVPEQKMDRKKRARREGRQGGSIDESSVTGQKR